MCPLRKTLVTLAWLEVGSVIIVLTVYALGVFLGRFDGQVMSNMLDAFYVFLSIATIAIAVMSLVSLFVCSRCSGKACGSDKYKNH